MQPDSSDPSTQSSLEARFWLWLAAILAAAGAAYAYLAAVDPIFQRAEDYFAESAREMLARGGFVTPILYGKPFFDKPILTYWAIEASFAAFGPTHFAARLPSLLAALATVAIIAIGVARVWSKSAGLAAAAILSTSYGFFYFATLSMADMWLTFFSTAAAVSFFAGSENPERRDRDWTVASVFCALAMLTKGPVGIVLAAGSLLLYLALRRELRQIRVRHLLIGCAALVVLAGGWFALLWREQGSTALRAFFVVENLGRFTGSTYRTHQPFGFIPLILLVNLLPWTGLFLLSFFASAPGALRRQDSRQGRAELFLWCCVATVVAFFWISRNQLDYYVLPAVPPCAALAGLYFWREAERNGRALRIGFWMVAAATVLSGVAGAIASLLAHNPELHGFVFLSIYVAAAGVAMAICLARRKYAAMLAVIPIAIFAGTPIALARIIPPYLRGVPVPAIAAAVRHAGPGEPLAVNIKLEHWRSELAFQTQRVPEQADTPEALAAFLREPGARMAVITDDWLALLPEDVSRRLNVVYRTRILRTGETLDILFDSARLERRMTPVSLVEMPGDSPQH